MAFKDTRCSRSIISASRCETCNRWHITVETIWRDVRCVVLGKSYFDPNRGVAKVDALVERDKPLGYDLLIGFDAIRELGGVVIRPTGETQLGRKRDLCVAIMIEKQDYCAVFDPEKRACNAKWKWTGNKALDHVHNIIVEYHYHHHHHGVLPARISLTLLRHPSLPSVVSGRSSRLHHVSAQRCFYGGSIWSSYLCSSMWRGPQEYVTYMLRNIQCPIRAELHMRQNWRHGSWMADWYRTSKDDSASPRGLIQLMAVTQATKAQERPVMDYREINLYLDAFTVNADVCAERMREWQQQGTNMALLDLRNTYLQLRIQETLWLFQTVIIKGRRYYLMRLGFGLNVVPLIMKVIVKTVWTGWAAKQSFVGKCRWHICKRGHVLSGWGLEQIGIPRFR